MSIDTLVVDLGGVVVRWDPRLVYPELTAAQFEEFSERIGFPGLNLRADAGEQWEDLVAQVAAGSATDAALLARYPERFHLSVPGPVPGMVDLVGEVLAAGRAVYGLTNWSAQTFHHGVAAVGLIGELTGVVVSGREGLIKPDPAIYLLLLERYRLRAQQVLFVDDRAENVEAARALGCAGHVFTTAPALRTELERTGLLPVPPSPTRTR